MAATLFLCSQGVKSVLYRTHPPKFLFYYFNVYIGTGKILMAPTTVGTLMKQTNSSSEPAKTSSGGVLGSVVNSVLDV